MVDICDAPPYVEAVLREYEVASLARLKSASSPRSTRAPAVVCVVKDELDRLPDLLRHYRQGGIERFVFIDNGSEDGSTEYLSQQPDVDLLQILRPFVWQRKQAWINLAIAMTGRGRKSWYIYVDADEHLVYDGYPQRSFADLVDAMERQGLRRVRGMLVDMYADGPLLQAKFEPGGRLAEAYPYFDAEGYVEARYKEIISRKGGPRQRVFGHVDPKFRPELTKYPLFRLEGRELFANPHHIWPYEGNFESPCYLGILHYKFLPNILRKIDDTVKRQNYWDGSIEYNCYRVVIAANANISLANSRSAMYGGVSDLLGAGLLSNVRWS